MSLYALIQWSDLFTSIINLSTVCSPRKEIEQYKEGEYIEAKYQGKQYRAIISEICDDRKKLQGRPLKFTFKKRKSDDGDGQSGDDNKDPKSLETSSLKPVSLGIKNSKDLAQEVLKKFLTRKEFLEEIKKLRKKIKDVRDEVVTEKTRAKHFRQCEETNESFQEQTGDAQSASSVSSVEDSVNEELFNGNSIDNLKDAISHTDKLYEAVRILMFKLFPDHYIISHSVSGKASNSKTERKMSFDARLYGVMYEDYTEDLLAHYEATVMCTVSLAQFLEIVQEVISIKNDSKSVGKRRSIEDTVRDMQNDIKKLKKRVNQLEKQDKELHTSTCIIKYNGLTIDDLKDHIKHSEFQGQAMNNLLKKMFSSEEILNNSICGKKSSKSSATGPRPAMDQEKLNVLFDVLRAAKFKVITGRKILIVYTNLKAAAVDKCIDMNKVMFFGSDGASVMTGLKNGLSARLRDDQPNCVNIHCMAHKLALCTSQAADDVSYFKHSSLRTANLSKIEEVLDDKQLKIKEIHSKRWFAFFSALEAVFHTWGSLVTYFEQVKQCEKGGTAKGIHTQLGQFEFVAVTYLLMDIMPILTKLSLSFQKENLDIALVQPLVKSTISQLEYFLQNDGHYMHELHSAMSDNKLELRNHTVSITKNKLTHVENVKKDFISGVITQIRRRFPVDDTSVIGALAILEYNQSFKTTVCSLLFKSSFNPSKPLYIHNYSRVQLILQDHKYNQSFKTTVCSLLFKSSFNPSKPLYIHNYSRVQLILQDHKYNQSFKTTRTFNHSKQLLVELVPNTKVYITQKQLSSVLCGLSSRTKLATRLLSFLILFLRAVHFTIQEMQIIAQRDFHMTSPNVHKLLTFS
ncbi:hypothetical protein KUTeg_014656 [Tegillarca granosa]|uniref:BEN domain-containing protein n=1 Tax=Tegillarca granosa TaxID=220873 RepID=A0ABQ9ERD7_TEGGR|nr:hypothetical protein KUTeg_014656 [Tegillarca granosa]